MSISGHINDILKRLLIQNPHYCHCREKFQLFNEINTIILWPFFFGKSSRANGKRILWRSECVGSFLPQSLPLYHVRNKLCVPMFDALVKKSNNCSKRRQKASLTRLPLYHRFPSSCRSSLYFKSLLSFFCSHTSITFCLHLTTLLLVYCRPDFKNSRYLLEEGIEIGRL